MEIDAVPVPDELKTVVCLPLFPIPYREMKCPQSDHVYLIRRPLIDRGHVPLLSLW